MTKKISYFLDTELKKLISVFVVECEMSRKNEFSPATKQLMQQMMKEKNISFKRQKEINKALAVGKALPLDSKFTKFFHSNLNFNI